MKDDPRIGALVAAFTPEGLAGVQPIGFGDSYLFFVGRDDCHNILHTLLRQETLGLKFNMFGYDDDELNQDILDLMAKPTVHVQGTLDRSQAGGVHEKKLIAHDLAVRTDLYNFMAVGQSLTHQITHTKGGVLLGQHIAWEGSMNWSDSGEGTGINLHPDGQQHAGWKAQNNTLLVSTNPLFLSRFTARLDVEHSIAQAQQLARAQKGPTA